MEAGGGQEIEVEVEVDGVQELGLAIASRACCRRYSTCSKPDPTLASCYHPTDQAHPQGTNEPRPSLLAEHGANLDWTRRNDIRLDSICLDGGKH